MRPLLPFALLVLALPPRAQDPVPASAPAKGAAEDQRVAARAGEATLSRAELEDLLLERHWASRDTQEILNHLVQTRLIDRLGTESGAAVSQREINALWDKLDRDARKAGVGGGMATELERTGMTPEEFREVLRLQILQQVLTRRALGLGKDAPVSGEQMEVWIGSEVEERGGAEMLNPPWSDGVVAVCGDVVVTTDELAEMLARHLPLDDVREAAFHALLLRGIRARMPDLADEAVEAAIDREVARRRAEVESDPAYEGFPFEQLLMMQGMTMATLRKDPAVRIAALSQVWVDRKHDEDSLRAAYERDRASFDDRFGEALRLHALFLRAAKFRSKLNPRTLEEAEEELATLKPRLDGFEAFVEHAKALSEDPGTKETGGDLGWVTRGADHVPPSVREAAFTWLGSEGQAIGEGVLLGPVRLDNGVVLVWVSARRDHPGWDVMRDHVHRELRARFLRDVLVEEDVVTFRDA
jgi:hypothetical protein